MRNKTVLIACIIVVVLMGLRFLLPSFFAIGADSVANIFTHTAAPISGNARIIAKPPQIPYDTFILSLGTSTASVGEGVYLENILVGKIVSVEGTYAHLLLLTSSGQSETIIVSRTGATITLQGISGGTFSVRLPKDFDIQVGDVLTDETTGDIVAQVYSVGVVGADSFKQVLAKVPGNIFAAQYFQVGLQVSQ